jgi:hypothetical protein
MDLSDASEKIPSDTTGDRSGDIPTSSAACVFVGGNSKWIFKKRGDSLSKGGGDGMNWGNVAWNGVSVGFCEIRNGAVGFMQWMGM